MARSRVVRRESLPAGVTPGARMPGGPMVYIAERAEPGFVNLRRWYIREGATGHQRVGQPARVYSETPLPKGGTWRTNPYGGKYGWTLHALGGKAWSERGMRGADDASRLRHWYVRLPPEQRIQLQPKGWLPEGDPLLGPGSRFRPWVSDECIVTLIRYATAGAKGVKPLRFSVRPQQRELLTATVPRRFVTVYPIRELMQVFEANDTECELRQPAGVTLQQAANALGFDDLRKPIGMAPEKLYEAWRNRSERANAQQRLLLNTAYHRILLHKFLQMRRMTPRSSGERGREIERRAQLIQAYRVFVFDRRGCPVGLNVPLLEANNFQIKKLIDRNVPHAAFTRTRGRAQKFGAWLFTDVLRKPVTECKPENLRGLGGLLAMADRLR